jgi:hypothetical protein
LEVEIKLRNIWGRVQNMLVLIRLLKLLGGDIKRGANEN